MQRIALAAGPCGAGPYDAVASHLFGNVVGCTLVEQGVDVVQSLWLHRVVLVVHVDIFAEVGLDALDTHIKQRLQQLVLVPASSLVVSEVDGARIVQCGEVGCAARGGVFLLHGLTDVFVFFRFAYLFRPLRNVWQLPQGNLEAIVLEVLNETLWIGETLRVELPLAEPVGTEPACVQMDDVAGVVLQTQAVADSVDLISRKVCHTTHPNAERPQGRHLGKSCQHAVALQNLFGCLSANEEHIQRGAVVEKLHGTRRVVCQRQLAVVAGMVETAVHATAEVERNVLIATAVVDTLAVLVLQLEGLSAEVHLAETFACSHKALVGGTLETDGGALVACMFCGCSTTSY